MPQNDFPISYAWAERRANPYWPAAVPWAFAERHRAGIERLAGGTLEMIAERGGVSPQDLLLVVNGMRADELDPATPTARYVDWLAQACA